MHDRVASPFAAEGLFYLLVAQLSIQLGLQHVVIEGDAKSIINKSKRSVRERLEVWAIIDNIHQTKTSFQQLKFAYVPRSDLCCSDQENQIDSRKGNVWVEGKTKKCKRSVFWEHLPFRNLASTQASRVYFWRVGAS
ncbi:hypothetical protein Gotur_020520 [Gossypium turneri]